MAKGLEKINEEVTKFLNSPKRNTSRNETTSKDLNSTYECSVCDNLRWLSSNADFGTPEFGRILPCECQEVVWGTTTEHRLKNYSLLPDSQLVSFALNTLPDGLQEIVERNSFRAAFESAREFAENPTGWLVFSGPIGVGKTHLARAVVDQCINDGIAVRFEHCSSLLDELRSLTTTNDGDVKQRLEQIMIATVLVLDDLESYYSEWGKQQLAKVIEQRYKYRLPTLITTNHNPNTDETNPLLGRLQDDSLVKRIDIKRLKLASSLAPGVTEKMLKMHTFDKFKSNHKPEQLTPQARKFLDHAKQAARKFAEQRQKWLCIGGPSGTGKTHLALAIVNELRTSGHDVVFRFVPDMLEELRGSYYDERSSSFYEIFRKLKNVECLILDDLGSEQLTAWSSEKLYQLIVYRYDNFLPTVITSRGLLKKVHSIVYEHTLEEIYSDRTEHASTRESEHNSIKQYFNHYLDAILARLYDSDRVDMVAIEHEENRRSRK